MGKDQMKNYRIKRIRFSPMGRVSSYMLPTNYNSVESALSAIAVLPRETLSSNGKCFLINRYYVKETK